MAEIETVINDAKQYAGELLDDARDLVSTANRVSQSRVQINARELSWQSSADVDAEFAAAGDLDPFGGVFTPPSSGGISSVSFQQNYIPNVPVIPDAPIPLNVASLFKTPLPGWNVADFTKSAPNVNTNISFPSAPALNLPSQPGGAGSVIVVPDVVAPTFDDVMDVPTISELDVTGRIESEFVATRAELTVAADDYAESWMVRHCPNYHAGMAALEARITTAMAGGNAMDETWEEAIYDRANVRVNDQTHISQDALTKDYARRGFTLPPGAVMAGLSRIRHEGNRNLADVSGNIANQRAQIELQHLQFGMQMSATLRQHFSSAMQGYMQLVFTANGQALDYAKEIGRWAAELFNQRIQLYQLEMQRYQAEAQVYAVRLESAFAIIRQFEVQIEAEKLKIDLDSNEIALYEATIRGEQSKIDIYNSQLQGIRTQLEAEAQKMEVFETEVRAYTARISGKESEYNAYRAAIQGDAAKVDAYQSQVQAYGQQVDAAATVVSAERAISQSITDYNQSLISKRESDIRKYIAELQSEGTRFDSEVTAYKAGLERYNIEVRARLQLVGVAFDKDRLELQAAIASLDNNMRAQQGNVDSFLKSIDTQASIANSGASIIGDMAASALTTNNTVLTQEE